ncbi:hypothetical protein CQW49_18870 [Methylosinus trichosporium OB3b]|uniref:Uncharacterized protein n=1 Tax=Methylosinus trichosporium (strain ATCC 35070 / NCIMB 11131 / UNIQEM 75 / OB3b) TaxID=595536 RepID=A0A2D2D401_METT3|nr:hypothetical protein CQW49_18870 [Methylosinus trichosporium OB3b]OBS51200.1 hypothetical protein A8B73_17225 [Methylosinus sp. 3S-1]
MEPDGLLDRRRTPRERRGVEGAAVRVNGRGASSQEFVSNGREAFSSRNGLKRRRCSRRSPGDCDEARARIALRLRVIALRGRARAARRERMKPPMASSRDHVQACVRSRDFAVA